MLQAANLNTRERLTLPNVNPNLVPNIDPKDFTATTTKLREFFLKKGFMEVHTQNRLSIMAACEDPNTISTYNYHGNLWPLPQTGQMWLEYELLTNPTAEGFFCLSTSYRNEANPIEGRHNIIFPMFEFEFKGDLDALEEMVRELVEFLGFGKKETFESGNYVDMAAKYGVKIIENEQEIKINQDHTNPFFLKNFPEYTNPFWNMKRYDDGVTSKKMDVLIHGMETIGSAERSSDTAQMMKSFMSIEDGKYAQKLFDLFTKERVMAELEHFLGLNFIQRVGGGIGLGRLIKGLKASNLI
ncbi:MAG: hypothetical protein MUE53_00690 [Chitinophagales bacterium]|jgi:aspartyl/asparaginyl-tRNA synthetase|nr:hypothetical protein [Chitinophagales bacterium]